MQALEDNLPAHKVILIVIDSQARSFEIVQHRIIVTRLGKDLSISNDHQCLR